MKLGKCAGPAAYPNVCRVIRMFASRPSWITARSAVCPAMRHWPTSGAPRQSPKYTSTNSSPSSNSQVSASAVLRMVIRQGREVGNIARAFPITVVSASWDFTYGRRATGAGVYRGGTCIGGYVDPADESDGDARGDRAERDRRGIQRPDGAVSRTEDVYRRGDGRVSAP